MISKYIINYFLYIFNIIFLKNIELEEDFAKQMIDLNDNLEDVGK